jgi:hypothetical protein
VTQPLTLAELLELPPVINLVTLGRALGLSEPVVRERARKNEFAALGIRVLHLGAQYRVPTADVLQFLGIESPGPSRRGANPQAHVSAGVPSTNRKGT